MKRLEYLRGITDEECDRAKDRGETGYALMWNYDRSELREDMRRWLEAERQDPTFTVLPEGDFEVRFGRQRDLCRPRDHPDGRNQRDHREHAHQPERFLRIHRFHYRMPFMPFPWSAGSRRSPDGSRTQPIRSACRRRSAW